MPESRRPEPLPLDPARHGWSRPEQAHLLAHAELTPGHSHEHGHLVHPATGVLALTTRSGSWIAPPNRVVWVPSGFEHQHRAHGVTDMRIVIMPPELSGPLPSTPAVLVVTPLARAAILALTGPDTPARRDGAARDRLRQAIVDDLTAAPEQPLHLPRPHDDRLLAVTRLVEADLSAPATLAELGHRVGAGERTLSRLFRKETGMGFRQWRTQLRVHRALVLLADGVPVIDVAAACGWANPSAFIDAFGSLTGQSPGRYQRSLRRTTP